MILLLVQEQQRVLLTLLQPMIVFMKEMKQLLYLLMVFQVQMLQKMELNRLLLLSTKTKVHQQLLLQPQPQVLQRMQDHR